MVTKGAQGQRGQGGEEELRLPREEEGGGAYGVGRKLESQLGVDALAPSHTGAQTSDESEQRVVTSKERVKRS